MLSVLRSAGVLNRSSLLVKHHAAALAALNAKCQPIRDQVSLTLTSTTNQVAARSAATAAAAHNHGKMWAFERVITVSLIGLIPASFVMYHPSLDYILALGLCLHSHWGLHGICCDYIRPKLFGAPLAKLAELIVYLFSILAFGSVMYFNYTDVGLIHAFRALWKL